MRVLVIDDDRAFRDMLGRALDEAGHEVAKAGDGAAGLELVARWDPDVILLDVRMPRMDGAAFAARYRDRPGRHAPIVVVSAFRDARTEVKDAAAYLRKPFELDDLLALLTDVPHTFSPS